MQPGAHTGAYVIERTLGAGGGGVVYRAHEADGGRVVAIKVLRTSLGQLPGMVERFAREVAAAKAIAHPNIVEIFESGELAGDLYYAMEYIEGRNLHELVRSQGRLSVAEVVGLLGPILDAIEAAHTAGIVHRDIKPSNIMVCEAEGKHIIKLLDFGIAKVLSREGQAQGLTAPGQALGTDQYMAPEQIRGQVVDVRTDIYALGAMIFHLVTGDVPFGGAERTRILAAHLQSPPPKPSATVPSAACLDPIVLRCLAKKPDDRYQTVAELRESIAAVAPVSVLERRSSELEVLLEIRVADESTADAEDDACAVLDMVEEALRDLGLTVESSSLSGLRACLALEAGTDVGAQHKRLDAQLTDLAGTLLGRQGAHPAVRFALRSAARP